MPPKRQLVDQVFGRLTVLEESGRDKYGKVRWKCQCSCGNKTIIYVATGDLTTRNTTNCGCQRREKIIQRNINNTKHGQSSKNRTPLYVVWVGMNQRCFNPKHAGYHNYGGRGITICNEWLDYRIFEEWALTTGYQRNLTIERKDNDGNYEPNNCEWIPDKDQHRNKRNNRWLTIDGETKILTDWCKKYNISGVTINDRLKRGWSVEDAITKPTNARYKRKK